MLTIAAVLYFSLPVAYANWFNEDVVNNTLLEGDIDEDGVNDADSYRVNKSSSSNELHAPLPSFGRSIWPNKRIPYVNGDSQLSKLERNFIDAIIREFNRETCVKFVPRDHSDVNYVVFKRGYHCSSPVGLMNKGEQYLSLHSDCLVNRNDVLHEMMHVIGFDHEHSRPDRDDYVDVQWTNVVEGQEKNFRKREIMSPVLTTVPYDYKSVMHYPSHGSTKNGQPTIIPKNRNHSTVIRADGLSELDIFKINLLYSCNSRAKEEQCPVGWTYDSYYSNICYKLISDQYTSYVNATTLCKRAHSNATLPIFRDASEYISYGRWWNEYKPMNCHNTAWLGIIYNRTISNYTWVDGSPLTFAKFGWNNLLTFPNEFFTMYGLSGGHWFHGTKHNQLPLCQLRLNVHHVPSVTLTYPTSNKCPSNNGWYYDQIANICYYYANEAMSWNNSQRKCELMGGSLPFFNTREEYTSFRDLMRQINIFCLSNLGLGYIRSNDDTFTTVKGTNPSFYDWQTGYPTSCGNYVYVRGWAHWEYWKNIPDEKFWYFCQLRL